MIRQAEKTFLGFDNFASFPPVGSFNTLYLDRSSSRLYVWNGNMYVQVSGTGGSGGAVWGNINGNITNQTDLMTILNNKANVNHNHAIADSIYDLGNRNVAFNFIPENGAVQRVRLTASVQFGIATPVDTNKFYGITLFIFQDSVGNRAWTGFNNTSIDIGGVTSYLMLTLTPNYFDILEFVWAFGAWRLINAVFGKVAI